MLYVVYIYTFLYINFLVFVLDDLYAVYVGCTVRILESGIDVQLVFFSFFTSL